ncbi:MAG: DUF302 domain-containing protein [Myxococcales bacterium]|nr:DUF302 domain-containing protein [Myxococcales bacterium]
MLNFDVSYAITRRLSGTTLARARERITAALQAEGFGVLTEIDLQATLEKKIGAHVAPYVILGACNPHLAHQAITHEPAVGLLLPCNVVVAQDGDEIVLSAVAPKAMFAALPDATKLASVAEDADGRLRRAIANA